MEVLVKMSGLGKDGKSKPETLMLGQSQGTGKHTLVRELTHPNHPPGRFSMVCRDAHTHKAHRVPSLKLHNKEEEHLYALGDDRKNRKKDTSLAALDRVPPTTKEISQLHALMLETREAQESGGGVITIAGSKHSLVPMARTELSSVNLIQPQDRNLHGKAFGGLLMRLVRCAIHALHLVD
jgi:acyl-coenzyme A thioesterase 9